MWQKLFFSSIPQTSSDIHPVQLPLCLLLSGALPPFQEGTHAYFSCCLPGHLTLSFLMGKKKHIWLLPNFSFLPDTEGEMEMTILWLSCNLPPHSFLVLFLIAFPLVRMTWSSPFTPPLCFSTHHCDLVCAPYLLRIISVLPLGHINSPQQSGLSNSHIFQGGLPSPESVKKPVWYTSNVQSHWPLTNMS